jgi:hypothetical protein
MTSKPPDAETELLVTQVAQTRARTESDLRALAVQLRPNQLKERALEVTEQKAEKLAWRTLARVAMSPRAVIRYIRKHPAVGVGAALGVALLTWRAIQHHR